MRIDKLIPGMQFESPVPGEPGIVTFITSCPHPYYLLQRMVIWVMPRGQVMMDALLANHDLDMQPLPVTNKEVWRDNLRQALKLTR